MRRATSDVRRIEQSVADQSKSRSVVHAVSASYRWVVFVAEGTYLQVVVCLVFEMPSTIQCALESRDASDSAKVVRCSAG